MGLVSIKLFTLILQLSSSSTFVNSQADHDDLGHDGHHVNPVCEAFAAVFADAAANYTRCFIVNSRPMFLCTKCIDSYLAVNRAYDDLEMVSYL